MATKMCFIINDNEIYQENLHWMRNNIIEYNYCFAKIASTGITAASQSSGCSGNLFFQNISTIEKHPGTCSICEKNIFTNQ